MTKLELQILQEKWDRFDKSEKAFVMEMLILSQPNKAILLKEDRWWNTVGDILGIFDPTGVVDLINGLDYIRQGDYLFGFLSMISAIPYVGDAIAKPLIGVGKAGKFAKGASEAMKIVKNGGNTVEAAKILEKTANNSKMFDRLVKSVPSWGDKLKRAMDALPAKKLTGGLRKTLGDWIDLFSNVAKRRGMAGKLTGIMAAKLTKPMSKKEAVGLLKSLESQLKMTGKPFAKMSYRKGDLFGKYILGGLNFGLLWRNRAVSTLVHRSKFYLGFLDFLGIGNWKGPDEVVSKMGEQQVEQKYQQYIQTPQAKENWNFDMNEVPETTQITQKDETLPTTGGSQNKTLNLEDPIMGFLGQLFTKAA